MTNTQDQGINERLITEIRMLKAPENLKNFLEELLMSENADLFKHEYKDEYKKLVQKVIKETP